MSQASRWSSFTGRLRAFRCLCRWLAEAQGLRLLNHFSFYLIFGNNIQTHGYWEDDQNWSLKKKRIRESSGIGGVKNCFQCKATIPIAAMECKYCGFVYQRKPKESNEMVELSRLSKTSSDADSQAKHDVSKGLNWQRPK